MDDARLGSVIRAVRLRLGLRQEDVAVRARVGHSTVSNVEVGLIDGSTLGTVRRVAGAVGISVSLEPRWRGADLAKLIDERHAVMVREVIAAISARGWQALAEHTFNVRGERGSIDVFAWLPAARAVLLVEVKTRVVDLQDLSSSLDRKRRLAPLLARDLGWSPTVFGTVLVLPDATAARNFVARFEPLFATMLPSRTVAVRQWVGRPDRHIGGIWFLPISIATGTTGRRVGGLRVRRRVGNPGSPGPRSGRQNERDTSGPGALADPHRST